MQGVTLQPARLYRQVGDFMGGLVPRTLTTAARKSPVEKPGGTSTSRGGFLLPTTFTNMNIGGVSSSLTSLSSAMTSPGRLWSPRSTTPVDGSQ